MSVGYVIARENFKEALRHVSAEKDPMMFNLLYGLQSLTDQIEADFASLKTGVATSIPKKRAEITKKTSKKKSDNNLGRKKKKVTRPRK